MIAGIPGEINSRERSVWGGPAGVVEADVAIEAVVRTSTLALSNVTLPHGLARADNGLVDAARVFPEIARGTVVLNGTVTFRAVPGAFGMSREPWDIAA